MDFLLWQKFLFLVLVCFSANLPSCSVSIMQPQCAYRERSALLQFKHSFQVDCSVSDSPNAYPKMKSWIARANESCCSWDGIECDQQTGHVIGINLSSCCLYGKFPKNSSVFSLTQLKELNLADNNFNNSQIPSKIGLFRKLQSLNLSLSEFTGQIPSEITELWELSLLDLSWNSVPSARGQLPLKLEDPSLERLVRNLTRLQYLHLDTVDISSLVPNSLRNLTTLKSVTLTFSNLYGRFPTSIFLLPHLELLYLTGNEDLEGSLPEFQHNSPLKKLSLTFTAFSGQVPPSIGKLAQLEILSLKDCLFTGPIPYSFGNLTKLTILSLLGNNFSGDLPSSLTNLTQLQSFGLSNLKVRPDKLFPWLSNQKNLDQLLLLHMNIGGKIPNSIANLTSLTDLSLGENELTGQIPHWLMNLTQLQSLGLQGNQLKGSVPQEISQLAKLQDLSLSNNNLHANFDAFLKLKFLTDLELSGVSLTIPTKMITNESVSKFTMLDLSSCNLTVFPHFLHSQDELENLNLGNNKIHGAIPEWFINITRESLYKLDISRNFLTHFEHPKVALPWSHLEILYLQQNRLKGLLPIPPNTLVVYQVSNNLFSGGIPQQLCHANSLNYLDLSNNKLGGRIPNCISALSGSLYVLNLRGNNFHGTIPAYPISCKLRMINYSQNQLEGNVPRSLANCTMLEVIDIGNNNVKDTFPSWLGSLPSLQILILRHNKFYGRISRPSSRLDFQSLRIIDLSHNFHTSDLPSQYFQNWAAMKITQEDQHDTSTSVFRLVIKMRNGNILLSDYYDYSITITNKGNEMLYPKILTVFRVIDFSSNNFTGKIPSFIGELAGLQALNLSNNNLDGNIPSSLANMRNLESLDMSKNILSGKIPQKLTQLTFLEVFNVSQNELEGPIPQGNQFDAFDNSSFDGNTGLCGSPLSKKCGNAPPPITMTMDEKEDNSNLIDWIIRSLGCISGFAIGCAIGNYITDQNHAWFMETFGRKRRLRTRRAGRILNHRT